MVVTIVSKVVGNFAQIGDVNNLLLYRAELIHLHPVPAGHPRENYWIPWLASRQNDMPRPKTNSKFAHENAWSEDKLALVSGSG